MKGRRLGEFEELILLSIRGLEDDASSAAIQRVLQEQADRRASLGAIYAALDRLQRKGLVDSWVGEPTPRRGGRSRRYYCLTPGGAAAVAASRRIREKLWRSKESLPSHEPSA